MEMKNKIDTLVFFFEELYSNKTTKKQCLNECRSIDNVDWL